MATLSEAQQKAVDAGTHVLDPVHGFVPKFPVGAGAVIEEVPTADVTQSEAERIQAESEAVKETEKASKGK